MFLSKYFAWMAAGIPTDPKGPDPDNHQHLGTMIAMKPFNHLLSDQVEIRFGLITPANRGRVLDRYEITKKTAAHGSLRQRYSTLVREAERWEEGV